MRKIKSGLIQMSLAMTEGEGNIEEIKQAMLEKHLPYIEEAGKKGVQILCLQEIFNTPYFCPGQDRKWYASAESIPGKTVEMMQEYAKKYQMVMIVPIFEKEQPGVLYNTAAVIDADGTYLGKYRKNHIPHTTGFWEKFFFKPGNLGYPVFQTRYAKIGVYICYDRHFPDGATNFGFEWCGNRLQSIGNCCWFVSVFVEIGAACSCCCKWLLYGLYQSGWRREAVEFGSLLWYLLLCRSKGANFCSSI